MDNPLATRSSGVLLHPTSFPGPYGIGDLSGCIPFIDFLVASGQKVWQILPLGPTGYGDSPYASFSSFAGNPLLIDLDRLIESGLLNEKEVRKAKAPTDVRVDYGRVIDRKLPILRKSAIRFLAVTDSVNRNEFEQFCETHQNWLEDYSLFICLKQHFDARADESPDTCLVWNQIWDLDIKRRDPAALAKWRSRLQEEILQQKAIQFFFYQQWLEVKDYANSQGVSILGDLPIFVALDSADVWANPDVFHLDENLQPTFVAGVPPDYFSKTGQRWGNPTYNWAHLAADDFRWWNRRVEGTRYLVDIIRIDHFRGFAANWSIPADQPTAENGHWSPAPGMELFESIKQNLGEVPIIAEDLGVITSDVDALRQRFQFPGMRVLQFAFDEAEERSRWFLPHNYDKNTVVYTGTHDNDSVIGWHESSNQGEKQKFEDYLGHRPDQVNWEFIRMALGSAANLSIIPMQDFLGLGSESRMNTPSTTNGNWSWQMPDDYNRPDLVDRLRLMTELYDR
jgi:4-alpha-glucanotransferase